MGYAEPVDRDLDVLDRHGDLAVAAMLCHATLLADPSSAMDNSSAIYCISSLCYNEPRVCEHRMFGDTIDDHRRALSTNFDRKSSVSSCLQLLLDFMRAKLAQATRYNKQKKSRMKSS